MRVSSYKETAATVRSVRHTAIRRCLGAAAAGAVLAAVGLVGASPAFAAGSGYGPPSSTSSTSAGGFTAVAASQTVNSSGAKITATFGGETYVISIPAGDFTAPTQVTVYAPTDLGSIGASAGIEVVFSDPATGKSLSGTTLKTPIDVVVSSSAITKGDVVEVFNGSSFVDYTGTYSTSTGSANIEVTSDPTFAVVPPPKAAVPVTATVPAATTVHTGKPFLGEELVAGAAGVLGLAAIGTAFGVRRRRSA